MTLTNICKTDTVYYSRTTTPTVSGTETNTVKVTSTGVRLSIVDPESGEGTNVRQTFTTTTARTLTYPLTDWYTLVVTTLTITPGCKTLAPCPTTKPKFESRYKRRHSAHYANLKPRATGYDTYNPGQSPHRKMSLTTTMTPLPGIDTVEARTSTIIVTVTTNRPNATTTLPDPTLTSTVYF